jgi:hypothetical protein
VLRLKDGKKLRAEPGFIIAMAVKVGSKSFPLAGVDGIHSPGILTPTPTPLTITGSKSFPAALI